jgi:hypothetical protein
MGIDIVVARRLFEPLAPDARSVPARIATLRSSATEVADLIGVKGVAR